LVKENPFLVSVLCDVSRTKGYETCFHRLGCPFAAAAQRVTQSLSPLFSLVRVTTCRGAQDGLSQHSTTHRHTALEPAPRGVASGSAAGDEACSDEAWQGNVRKIAVPA